MDRRRLTILALLACMLASALGLGALLLRGAHDVEVICADEGRVFTSTEKRAIQETADAAFHDAKLALPALPPHLLLSVRFGKSVIVETGENATVVPPAEVAWTVDPDRDVLRVIRTQLRASLFHELHHLARAASVHGTSLMDRVITEGMATAFERDFAKADPPWGKAPPEVMDWLRELLAQPADASRDEWLIRHPDGRRWIGMRVGTFLVDRATKASGRSAASLVSASTDEILRLTEVR